MMFRPTKHTNSVPAAKLWSGICVFSVRHPQLLAVNTDTGYALEQESRPPGG